MTNTKTEQQIIIGTLGDMHEKLTCSLNTAHNKLDSLTEKIQPYPSFEAAIDALKNYKIHKCLVPAAYPKIANFITDTRLDIKEIFLDNLPDLVLVGVGATIPKTIDTLYLHPATESIIPDSLQNESIKKVFVSSNSEACRKVIENPSNSIAITNELASNYYHLYSYSILREKMKMPFIVFNLKYGYRG